MHVKKVACVGAGLIGSSWATLYSAKGLEVILEDLSKAILETAMARIRSNLDFLERKSLIESGGAEAALTKITTTLNLAEAVDKADFVTESVTEDYAIKKKVFQEMDAHAPSRTILASSSSGLMMTEIQKVTTEPERCVLTHPILPPHLIPLVEIAGGENTHKETIGVAREFMLKMGKVPIVLNKEVAGYIVNRLQAALWREAISLVSQGVTSALDVDRAFCMGIGLRDPILGPYLRAHIAGKGIKNFIDTYGQSYSNRWATMETWTTIPPVAVKKVIKSVDDMDVVRGKTLDEIEQQRDEELVKILKIIRCKHPFY